MGPLRAGAARNVITPDLGSHIAGYFEDRIAEDTHDDLCAKALVLESGDTSIAIVACDLIGLKLEDTDRAKALAHELTGIPADNIFICCTHTHFGPTTSRGVNVIHGIDYMDWLPGRIADSVKMAQNRLRRGAVAYGVGFAKEGYNRRYHMKNGSVVTNPGILNPDIVGPAGPTDPEVGLLSVMDEERNLVAALASYSLHYVGGPYGAVGSLKEGTSNVDTSITADYFGAFDAALQRMAGVEFVGIMLNGCSGDINNIDVTRPAPDFPDPWYQIRRVADVVAAAAYQGLRSIRLADYQTQVKLGAANDRFMLRRREFSPQDIAAARERLKGQTPKNLGDRDWLTANTILHLSELPLEQPTLIQAMRIGDVGLAGFPGEIFVEIGMEVKKRSPFKRTLTAELANDAIGYIPTPKAFEEGSYEAYTTPTSPTTAPAMVESAVKLLNGLFD